MNFLDHHVKGIARCLLDEDLQGEPLHVHLSEVGPGERSHPPHRHGGIEAFYMLEGEATLEIDGETFVLKANEAAVFDPNKLHGLLNSGPVPMRYIVIISKNLTTKPDTDFLQGCTDFGRLNPYSRVELGRDHYPWVVMPKPSATRENLR